MPDASTEDLELEAGFRELVRGFVERTAPLASTRAHVDGDRAYDLTWWRRAATELEIVEVIAPESVGGQGAGPVVAGIVFEEFGRNLVPSPLLGTVGLALPVLAAVGSEDAADIVAELLDGSRTATLGWVGSSGSWDPADTPVRWSGSGDEISLSGELHHVVDGDTADVLLVVARAEEDRVLSLVAIDADGPGVTIRRLEALDPTRHLARVDLEGARGRLVGGRDATSAIDEALLSATVLLAAESVGGARRAMEMAVDYAKVRYQFGRPIGSFQAIKHACATMLAEVELAAAVSTDALRQPPESAQLAVRAAKAAASDTFFDVASESVQIHGGIGFTWEHDAHLFFRRAASSSELLGGPQWQRSAIAATEGWSL